MIVKILENHNILKQFYPFKINELIQSSQAGEFFFSTQLLLKITVFEFNNRFLFHITLPVAMQSKVEFLKLIHDFLTSGNIVRSRVYIFYVVSV